MGSPDESMEIVREVLKDKFQHGLVKSIKSENKQGKIENGILALSAYHAFVILPTKSTKHGVEHDFNYLEIKGIESEKDKKLKFILENGKIVSVSTNSLEDTDCLIEYVATSLLKVFPQTPISKLIMSFRLEPNKRETDLMNKLETLPKADIGPCGGFSRMYGCMCDYLRLTYMPEVAWDIDTIYLSQNCRDLCLNDFDHLHQRDLAPIIAALEYNSFFSQLSANSLKIKLSVDPLTKAIVQVMKKSAIDKLVLVDCNLKHEFAHGLNTALLANTKCCLTHLDLSHNPIEDRGIQAMSDRLAKLPDGLAVLRLAKTNITSRGVSFMFKTFHENERMANLLKVLDISHASLKDGDLTDLKNFLANPNALTHLDLSFTGLSLDELFNALCRGCLLKLSHLNLAGNTFTTKKTRPPPIPASIKQFFSSAIELKVIGLSGNKIPPDVVKEILLAIGMNKNIIDVELDLSSNELKAAGSLMLESVIAGVGNIRSLNISDNEINEGLASFLDWVCANKTLKVLDVSKNLSRAKSVEKVMESIVKLIQEEDLPLENLSIADCHLNYETIVLINALGSNTSLTSIDLSGNNMRDLGAKMLAKALMINSKLAYVNCDRNNITSDGYREIANALERNYTLKNFPMPVHDVHNTRQDASKLEAPLYQIQRLLQRNHSSRKFVDDQAFRLQQGFLYTTAHQMVDRMVVQIQDKSVELESQDSDVVKEIVEEGDKYIKDADNSKQLLARMHEVALKSSLQAVESKLKSLASEVQETVQTQLKETLSSMLDCAEDECDTVMGKADIKSELLLAVDERAVLPDRFMQDVLDQAASDISNKISEVHLAMAAQISDTVVGDILANLEDCFKNLADHAENVPTLSKSTKSRDSTISGGKFIDDDEFDALKIDERPAEPEPAKPTPVAALPRVKEDKPVRKVTKKSIRPKSQFILQDTTDMGVEPEPTELPSLVETVIISPRPVAAQIKPQNDIGTGGAVTPLPSLTKSRPKPRRNRPTRPTVPPPEAGPSESKDSFVIQHVDDFYTPVAEEPINQNDVKGKRKDDSKKDQKKKAEDTKAKVVLAKAEKKSSSPFSFFTRNKKEKRDKSPNPNMSPNKEKTSKKKEDAKDKKAKEDKKKRKGSKDIQPAPVEEKPTPPPAEAKPPSSPAVIQPAAPPVEEKPAAPPEEKVEKKALKPPGAMGFGNILGQADLNKHLSKRKSNPSMLSAKEDEPDKATKKEEERPKVVDKIQEEVIIEDKPVDAEKQDKNTEDKEKDEEPLKVIEEVEKEPSELKKESQEADETMDKSNKVDEIANDEIKDNKMTNSEESVDVDEKDNKVESSVEEKVEEEEKGKTEKENIEIKQASEHTDKEEKIDTADKEVESTPQSDEKLNANRNELPQKELITDTDTHTSSEEPTVILEENTAEKMESSDSTDIKKDNKENVQDLETKEKDEVREETKEEIEEKKEDKIEHKIEHKIEENREAIKEESSTELAKESDGGSDGKGDMINDTTAVCSENKPEVNGTAKDNNDTPEEKTVPEKRCQKTVPEKETKPLTPKPLSPKHLSPTPLSPVGNQQRHSFRLDVNSETSTTQNNELKSPSRLSPAKPIPTPKPSPRPKSVQPEARPPPPITKPRPSSVVKPKPLPSTRPKPTKKPTTSLHSVNEMTTTKAETNGTSNGDVASTPETPSKPQVKARPKSIDTSPSKTSPEIADKNLSPQ